MSLRLYPLAFLFLLLNGCVENPAIVVTRDPPPSIQINTHKVERGETLFSIAWRYDLRWEELAAANSLCPPFLINPGQEIKLTSSIKNYRICDDNIHVVQPGDTLYSISKLYDVEVKSIINLNGLENPFLISPGDRLSITLAQSQSNLSKTVTNAEDKKAKNTKILSKERSTYPSNWTWKWPLDGKIVEDFDLKKSKKGIRVKNISSSQIKPAAPGNVVYAGSGLRGYGNLVIIKHSDNMLSAYANNKEIIVEVGQSVSQNDAISRLDKNQIIYFEIRRDGSPVDPLRYLK